MCSARPFSVFFRLSTVILPEERSTAVKNHGIRRFKGNCLRRVPQKNIKKG